MSARPPGRRAERWYAAYCRRPDHPMKLRLERWLATALGLDYVHAASPTGVWYRLYTGDFVQSKILREGAYEPRTLDLVRRLLQPGDTMVDVGGHVGQYALHAARAVGRGGTVVVVEPNPRTYAHLLHNLRLNDAVQVTPVLGAVATEPGVLPFVLPAEGNWGGNRVAARGRGRDESDAATLHVLALPLSSMLDRLGVPEIHILKIDVEGFELNVLRSLDFRSPRRPRHVILEFEPALAAAHGGDARDLLTFLRDRDYELRDVAGEPYDPGAELPESNLWAVDRRRQPGTGELEG